MQATITNLTEYGCFAEIESGVEGLVHVSKWIGLTRSASSKVVSVGDETEVMILEIDKTGAEFPLASSSVGLTLGKRLGRSMKEQRE